VVVHFSCGHVVDLDPSKCDGQPRCPTCGQGRVTAVRVWRPTFTGSVQQPEADDADT
jgi:hypothetical protein